MVMKNDIKIMDIKEFRAGGFLQELNRTFLHPLGLAMSVLVDEDGNESIGDILDYRDDPEGVIFDLKNSDDGCIEIFEKNYAKVYDERKKHAKARFELFGTNIEPIKPLI